MAFAAKFERLDVLVENAGVMTEKRQLIVVVSSNMHSSGKFDFDDLASEKRWSGSYPRSKLANMLFVRALARRLAGTGVVVNGLHPDVISTELARDFAAPIRLLAKWFFKSPEQGARTSLYLATAPEAAAISVARNSFAHPGRKVSSDLHWTKGQDLPMQSGGRVFVDLTGATKGPPRRWTL